MCGTDGSAWYKQHWRERFHKTSKPLDTVDCHQWYIHNTYVFHVNPMVHFHNSVWRTACAFSFSGGHDMNKPSHGVYRFGTSLWCRMRLFLITFFILQCGSWHQHRITLISCSVKLSVCYPHFCLIHQYSCPCVAQCVRNNKIEKHNKMLVT